jgi:bifunctional ADP-heptose synthase (sugar kinase/adenylyltransferase)
MLKTIQQLQSLNVLVIGDYCIDIFKYGSCTRLSPEAPVPVFDYLYENKMEGMSGNVYNNLINLNINCDLIKNKENINKIRYVDIKSKQHIMREDVNENKICELDTEQIKKYDYHAVIISDYDKGFITKNNIQKILSLFKCPIIVDSKKNDLSLFENCIIKINENEFKKVTKFPKKYELIITLGEKGAKYNNIIIPTNKVQVFDVSGAGDTFISAFTVKYLLSKSCEQSITFANFCSSLVVSKSGTSSVILEEVIDKLY